MSQCNYVTRLSFRGALPHVSSPLRTSWTPDDSSISASDNEEVAPDSKGATSDNTETFFDHEKATADNQEMIPSSVTLRKRFRWSIAPTPSKQPLSRSSDKHGIFASKSESVSPDTEIATPEGKHQASDSECESGMRTNPLQVHPAPSQRVDDFIETGNSASPEGFSLQHYRYFTDNGKTQAPITGFYCMACNSELATEWPGPDTCDRCTRFGRLTPFTDHSGQIRVPVRMSLDETVNVLEYSVKETFTVSTNF